MSTYAEKIEARKARLSALAESAKREADALHAQARAMASVIPFGQPILVGHHSEGRDRNYRARIHNTYGKAFRTLDKAEHYERRAERIGTGGISSDDPEATQKLRAELQHLEDAQERMKAANRVIRSRKAREEQLAQLEGLGFSSTDADKLLKKDGGGNFGFPSYALQNNRANAARVRDRIAEIEALRAREEVAIEGAGYTYREDVQENRVMFLFDGKPDEVTRVLLKQHAFKWSPSREGKPWVRQLTTAAIHAAKEVRKALDQHNQPSED